MLMPSSSWLSVLEDEGHVCFEHGIVDARDIARSLSKQLHTTLLKARLLQCSQTSKMQSTVLFNLNEPVPALVLGRFGDASLTSTGISGESKRLRPTSTD